MPVDLTLVKTALRVLSNNGGRANLTEEVIGIDIETILRRPLAVHQVLDALAECARQEWAHEEKDDFGLPVWHITIKGEEKLKAF
jgi:phosphopantetheinyl transferase